jgi:hypothetical protein
LRILRPDDFQSKILQSHGRLDSKELKKLSSLFKTLSLLEDKLGVFLADFVDNMIDAGDRYVIIDFGQ